MGFSTDRDGTKVIMEIALWSLYGVRPTETILPARVRCIGGLCDSGYRMAGLLGPTMAA